MRKELDTDFCNYLNLAIEQARDAPEDAAEEAPSTANPGPHPLRSRNQPQQPGDGYLHGDGLNSGGAVPERPSPPSPPLSAPRCDHLA
eukprot:2165695-Prymnesium_polylepis.1